VRRCPIASGTQQARGVRSWATQRAAGRSLPPQPTHLQVASQDGDAAGRSAGGRRCRVFRRQEGGIQLAVAACPGGWGLGEKGLVRGGYVGNHDKQSSLCRLHPTLPSRRHRCALLTPARRQPAPVAAPPLTRQAGHGQLDGGAVGRQRRPFHPQLQRAHRPVGLVGGDAAKAQRRVHADRLGGQLPPIQVQHCARAGACECMWDTGVGGLRLRRSTQAAATARHAEAREAWPQQPPLGMRLVGVPPLPPLPAHPSGRSRTGAPSRLGGSRCGSRRSG
jgi:hypothetical protein